MLLTITSTTTPATDLGYLLAKNPARLHSFDLAFGKAHVFYPEATAERCTAALLLEVDPVGLVRGRRGPAGEGGALEQYVNDRPYVASSFLSVAIARVLGSALGGRSKDRPELAQQAIPLEARVTMLPCRGGEDFLRRLFEPLGYEVTAVQHALDETNPAWGASRYFTVRLRATKRLVDLLTHLYVLVPVLDDDKHYWVGDDEVEKLLRHGAGWLETHPEREAIAHRYLAHQKSLARAALDRLSELRTTLLKAALPGLERYVEGGDLRRPTEHRLAFRELGLAIGLHAAASMREAAEDDRGHSRDSPEARGLLEKLGGYDSLRGQIVAFWLEPGHRRNRTWTEHRDIDEVMLATALAPEGFLALGP